MAAGTSTIPDPCARCIPSSCARSNTEVTARPSRAQQADSPSARVRLRCRRNVTCLTCNTTVSILSRMRSSDASSATEATDASLLASALLSARQGGGVEVHAGLSIRELARRAGVSAAQISRIESGQVLRPSREILVALGKALDRNPLPLLILANYLTASEARDALRPLFRDGAELPEEWGPGQLGRSTPSGPSWRTRKHPKPMSA